MLIYWMNIEWIYMFNGTTFSMQGEEVFFERRSPFQIKEH